MNDLQTKFTESKCNSEQVNLFTLFFDDIFAYINLTFYLITALPMHSFEYVQFMNNKKSLQSCIEVKLRNHSNKDYKDYLPLQSTTNRLKSVNKIKTNITRIKQNKNTNQWIKRRYMFKFC